MSAIKKGFLSSAKSSVYPESVSAKIKPKTNGLKTPPILLPDMNRKNKNESGDIRGGLNISRSSGMEGAGSLVEELTDAEVKQLAKTGSITKTKHIPAPAPAPALGPPSTSSPVLPSQCSMDSKGNREDNKNSTSNGDDKMSFPSSSQGLTPSPSLATHSSIGSSSSVCHDSSVRTDSSTDGSRRRVGGEGEGEGGSRSKNTHTSTVTHGADKAHSPSPSSTEQPSKAPQYTLLERGIVSMGDFETLKSRDTSTRSAPYPSISILSYLFLSNLFLFHPN